MSAARKVANAAKVGGGLTLGYLLTIFVTRTEFTKLEKECHDLRFEAVCMPEWLDKRKAFEEEIARLRERVAKLEAFKAGLKSPGNYEGSHAALTVPSQPPVFSPTVVTGKVYGVNDHMESSLILLYQPDHDSDPLIGPGTDEGEYIY